MKVLLEEYFASVENSKVRTLEELIQFNEDHAEQELPASTCLTKNDASHPANSFF